MFSRGRWFSAFCTSRAKNGMPASVIGTTAAAMVVPVTHLVSGMIAAINTKNGSAC